MENSDDSNKMRLVRALEKGYDEHRIIQALRTYMAENKNDIDLEGIGIRNSAAKRLASALKNGNLPDIREMDLNGNQIEEDGAIAIAKALPSCNISDLYLSANNIGNKGAIAIAGALLNASKLTRYAIDLLNAFKLTRFAGALRKASTLTRLEISDCQITTNGVIAIAEALPSCNISDLDLSENNIGNKGANAIAGALRKASKLTRLEISHCQLTTDGAIAIAEALPHCNISDLDLSRNNIGNEGAIAIANALKNLNCNLTTLFLSYHDIDGNDHIQEEGRNAIANALKVNMTLTDFRPSSFDTSEEVPLNRRIRQLFFELYVQELFFELYVKKKIPKKLGSEVLKQQLIPNFSENNFNNDAWNNLYREDMKNISSLSRFVNYLKTSDPINVKKKIKKRILFLKRNKIKNHVPAQLDRLVKNALYNDVRQQQINNVGEAIYNIQLRLKKLSKQQMQMQMQIQTNPSFPDQSSSSSSSSS